MSTAANNPANGPGSLRGVVRVRAVRERDSRIGLSTALGEEQRAADRVAALEEQLTRLPEAQVYDLTAFRARQHSIEALHNSLSGSRTELEGARQLALAARERWMADRSRLAAVESLVERRAAAARAERRRREDREQDEVATELWRRGRVGFMPAPIGGAS